MLHSWMRSCLRLRRRQMSSGHRIVNQQCQRPGVWNKVGMSLWSYLKRVGHMTKSYLLIKLGPHKPLLVYGMAAFLWEKEKVPEQELQRCLQYYEDRVKATCDYMPTTTTTATRVDNNNSSPSPGSWFTWFSWQLQGTAESEPIENRLVDEKELKRQEMVDKLTALYTECSEKKLSQLPLVGINSKVPLQYKIGSLLVKKTKESVVSLLKQAAAITQAAVGESLPAESKPISLSCCQSVSDVSCLEFELHHHQFPVVWIPVPVDRQSTIHNQMYPLVGLHDHHSKVMDMLVTFVDRPSVQNSLNWFIYSLDQFLSVDTVQNHSLFHQANQLCHSFLQHTLQTVDNMFQEDCSVEQHIPSKSSIDSECQLKSTIDYLSDWEVFINEPMYMVFRKLYADTGLYQFKVIGTYDDITANEFFEVQVDEKARKSWDHYVAKLNTVDFDPSSGCGVVHWVMKFPFPMSAREYVYVRKSWKSSEDGAIVVVNRSVDYPSLPESSEAVRVKGYYSEMVIKPHTCVDHPGFNYELTYFDDPQIHLPASCVNWVANSAMPDFLNRVRKAALSRRISQGPIKAT